MNRKTTNSKSSLQADAIAASGRERVAFLLCAMAAAFVLFHLRGNMVHIDSFGHSAFRWMIGRWQDTVSYGGVDYSHGWILPLISMWLIWRDRKNLLALDKTTDPRGLLVLGAATAVHFAGLRIAQTRLSLFALIIMLWGLPFYLLGWRTAARLAFPVGYLIFCIPLNFLHVLTFPLRLFSARLSVLILNGLGVVSVRAGTRIMLDGAEQYTFNVADPCSGLRSLLAIAGIIAVYGYVTQTANWKRLVLFTSCIPLAMFGNIARIVTLGLVAVQFGEDVAMDLYHDYSGFFVFAVVILAMMALGRLIDRVHLFGGRESS
jgi:exosortase